MRILGINYSNDAAATLLVDGNIVSAIKEERFSRIKHDRSFPVQAVEACLAEGKTDLMGLDAVAVFWNPAIHLQAMNYRFSGLPRHHMEFLYNIPNNLFRWVNDDVDYMEQVFHFKNGRKLQVFYVNHHAAHAASALFRSSFESSAILTVDGYGEKDSTVIWDGSGNRLKRLWTREFPHSIGSFYAAITQFLGFRANSGEGKVMGLASYGAPIYKGDLARIFDVRKDGFELDLSYFRYYMDSPTRYSDKLVDLLGPPRKMGQPVAPKYDDIAASAQSLVEDALISLARQAGRLTGRDNFSMAGGVTLNCAANGMIVREAGFKNYFFQPSSCDGGSSMGAALYVYHVIMDNPRQKFEVGTDYLGIEFSQEEIDRTLKISGITPVATSDPVSKAAELLSREFIGSTFQGRDEFGPRSLGNRSILADPRNSRMKDVLNARVKFREPFRPFAPSILFGRVHDYFDDATESPFMLRIFKTSTAMMSQAGAVTHVDGGARVQTVREHQNPRYYRLIREFGELTGTPMLLNTSFNIRGEPIVHTPREALQCFLTTDMDFLLLGDSLVVKNKEIL